MWVSFLLAVLSPRTEAQGGRGEGRERKDESPQVLYIEGSGSSLKAVNCPLIQQVFIAWTLSQGLGWVLEIKQGMM